MNSLDTFHGPNDHAAQRTHEICQTLEQRRPSSVPLREQRQVDRRVIRDHPPLEHDTTGAGRFEPIAVRCRRTRLRLELTVWAVAFDEFLHIREQ